MPRELTPRTPSLAPERHGPESESSLGTEAESYRLVRSGTDLMELALIARSVSRTVASRGVARSVAGRLGSQTSRLLLPLAQ